MAALLEREPGIRLSVSYTTRAPRPGERDGVHYHFVDEPRFLELKAKGLGLLTEKIEVKAGVSIGAALAEAKARASARVVNAPPVALPLADPTAPSSHANTHRAVDPFGD